MLITLVSDLNYNDTFIIGSKNMRSWYHERDNESDTLLITVGDSWTWGDSLGKINITNDNIYDDYHWRTTHIWGYYISEYLNSDWINIGNCGASNSMISDIAFEKILPKLNRDYKNITVIFTLTENGREILYDPIFIPNINIKNFNLKDFLILYEQNMLLNFSDKIKNHPTVKFLFSRNFTQTWEENLNIVNEVNYTWVDIISQNLSIGDYPKSVRYLTNQAQQPLIEYLKQQKLLQQSKQDLTDMMFSNLLAIEWLENSTLNYQKASKHPTEEAHKLWAKYLIENYYESI